MERWKRSTRSQKSTRHAHLLFPLFLFLLFVRCLQEATRACPIVQRCMPCFPCSSVHVCSSRWMVFKLDGWNQSWIHAWQRWRYGDGRVGTEWLKCRIATNSQRISSRVRIAYFPRGTIRLISPRTINASCITWTRPLFAPLVDGELLIGGSIDEGQSVSNVRARIAKENSRDVLENKRSNKNLPLLFFQLKVRPCHWKACRSLYRVRYKIANIFFFLSAETGSLENGIKYCMSSVVPLPLASLFVLVTGIQTRGTRIGYSRWRGSRPIDRAFLGQSYRVWRSRGQPSIDNYERTLLFSVGEFRRLKVQRNRERRENDLEDETRNEAITITFYQNK